MGDQILRSAKITFKLPKGDDKDTDTAVSVHVTTRFNRQFDIELASKSHFADTDTWEDTGNKEYTYSLDFTPFKITQLDPNVRTKITLEPKGNDTVKFGYHLELIFDDDDASTAEMKIVQDKADITLSQDNREYAS